MGTCRRPSWTPMVWPTICGKMVESRDQVLSTRFSLDRFMISMRASSFASTYGPFFTDRDTLLLLHLAASVACPADDQLVAGLALASAQTHGRFAPRRLRLAANG